MTNNKITSIITATRFALICIIKEHLLNKGNQKIHVEIPNAWNDDNYYTEILTKVSLSDNGIVYITSTSDLENAEVSTDEIELYSLDEIIKIIEAL